MSDAVSYLLMVTVCFVVVPVALTRGPLSMVAAEGVLSRWTEWRLSHRPSWSEDLADEAIQYARADRQIRDVEVALDRLRRLIASDQHMSATRQLGNRLAYNRLLLELRRLPRPERAWEERSEHAQPAYSGWSVSRTEVEILDFRWR